MDHHGNGYGGLDGLSGVRVGIEVGASSSAGFLSRGNADRCRIQRRGGVGRPEDGAVAELQARTGHEIDDRAGDEDFARLCVGRDRGAGIEERTARGRRIDLDESAP